MDELAHRFLVAAHPHGDLRRPLATGAGQHHLAATHQHAIRRAQTGCQGRALLVGERTDKDGRSHTSQDTPFRPTFTEITLDSLLFLGAAAALSWSFLLAPLFNQSMLSPLARGVSLTYPLGDLLVLVGLALVFLRPHHYRIDRLVLGIVVAAFACLMVGDSVAVALVLHPQHVFRRGDWPDLFWMAAYLLFPLAALVQLRLAQRTAHAGAPVTPVLRVGYRREDVLASLRLVLPVAAAVLASVALLLPAALTETRI